MIDWPMSTEIHRVLPKKAFYEHLPMTTALKQSFVDDVGSIILSNSLKKDNLNLMKDSEVKEILLLHIVLRKKKFDDKIVEAIAKQNPHALIFLLEYGDEQQLAVYQGKLYRSAWQRKDDLQLQLSGGTLDEIWADLVRQIAVRAKDNISSEISVEQQLRQQDEIDRLDKLIQKTQKAVWKERQPRKRYELYEKLKQYKKQREDLIHG